MASVVVRNLVELSGQLRDLAALPPREERWTRGVEGWVGRCLSQLAAGAVSSRFIATSQTSREKRENGNNFSHGNTVTLSLSHSLINSLTHSLTQSVSRLVIHSVSHSLIHQVSQSLTHSLTQLSSCRQHKMRTW
jgi:hypothetical protein